MLENDVKRKRFDAFLEKKNITREQAAAIAAAVPAALVSRISELDNMLQSFNDSYLDCRANYRSHELFSKIMSMAKVISELNEYKDEAIASLPDDLRQALSDSPCDCISKNE